MQVRGPMDLQGDAMKWTLRDLIGKGFRHFNFPKLPTGHRAARKKKRKAQRVARRIKP